MSSQIQGLVDNRRDVAAATAGNPESSSSGKKRLTGIVGLNLLLEGGFPEGTTIMVHGTAVSGLDLAALQFVAAGAEDEGTYLRAEDIINHEKDDSAEIKPEMFLMQMAGSRIVVDSVTAIIERYGIDDALTLLRLLKEDVQKTSANLMFLVFAGIHTPLEMTKLMREADIVIEFRCDTHQAEIERTLAVHKIKNAAAPQRLLPFIITDKGIEASTTSRVV